MTAENLKNLSRPRRLDARLSTFSLEECRPFEIYFRRRHISSLHQNNSKWTGHCIVSILVGRVSRFQITCSPLGFPVASGISEPEPDQGLSIGIPNAYTHVATDRLPYHPAYSDPINALLDSLLFSCFLGHSFGDRSLDAHTDTTRRSCRRDPAQELPAPRM